MCGRNRTSKLEFDINIVNVYILMDLIYTFEMLGRFNCECDITNVAIQHCKK